MKPNRYPTGWNADRVRHLLQHYERQTEEEAVAEDEAAFRRRDQTVMVVPKTLVPRITRLLATEGLRKQSGSRRPNPSQGSGVKRADGCTTGVEWPSVEQTVKRRSKGLRLT